MKCSCGSTTKIHPHKQKLARYILRHWDDAAIDERGRLKRRAKIAGYKFGGVEQRLLEQLRKDAA